MILGVDVGGTFTDFCLLDDAGQLRVHKRLTSAGDPSLSILEGIAEMAIGSDATVVHGTTVATNALLERRGARTALVTTAGFGDVLEIGRQTRPSLYALHPRRPEPLVPSKWRFELPERVVPLPGPGPRAAIPSGVRHPSSAVTLALDMEATDAVVQRLLEEEIESVAVCFLFSFLYPAHEEKVRERILALGGDAAPAVSLSSEVLPEFREYERTSTTVINAYVAPLVGHYLSHLEQRLESRRLRIMQSNGGSISAEAARTLAARTALSGPAGGVVGAFELARQAGFEQVVTFDMGGTSTDVSLCPGRIQETTEGAIAGFPLHLPAIDIHTVGAGGGSIARVDTGGALRVGPESAGADPGPACYDHPDASHATVTDANLVLGRLDADHFLGGHMHLNQSRSRQWLRHLAHGLDLPLESAAWGVLRVANSNMERAIRTISVERGHDPRRFTLVAFGGAGPLHACELASALHIPHVLVPPRPGVLSALGMILADLVKDYSLTVMLALDDAAAAGLEELFLPMCERATSDLRTEGLAASEVYLCPALDMRYVGQSYEITVPLAEAEAVPCVGAWSPWTSSQARLAQAFHAAHSTRFGYASEREPVEIVNLRLKAIGRTPKPVLSRRPAGASDAKVAHVGHKQVFFSDPESNYDIRPFEAALYERERLAPGHVVVGPAVLFQLDCTTVIPPRWSGIVDGWGNLILQAGA
jgi:N-methylhydantoinase A